MPNVTRVLLEAVLILALGVLVGVAANAISPRGLHLNRDYFGTPSPPSASPLESSGQRAGKIAGTDSSSLPAATQERLRKRSLQAVTHDDVAALFRDPRYAQGLVVLIDARSEQHYAAGHIPGAWQFDHYRVEDYLSTILPVCLPALEVVVYCTGAECDDSELAAVLLRDLGVPSERLRVYSGGITEWKDHRLPLETGPRRSGTILDGPR